MQPTKPPPVTEAQIAVEPLINAAISVTRLRFKPEDFAAQLSEVTSEIAAQTSQLKKGDASKIEELLYAQALTLDATFHKFLAMAASGTSQVSLMNERFEVITGLAALALKAQEQSRKTLVALAEIKNPKRSTTFIKNYVDKQLNQLDAEPSKSSCQPKQLQEDNRATLDNLSQGETTTVDTAMETVAEVYGSSNTRRESNKRQKQHQTRVKKC